MTARRRINPPGPRTAAVPTKAVTPEERAATVRLVTRLAHDAADRDDLLEALGLTELDQDAAPLVVADARARDTRGRFSTADSKGAT